MINLRDNIFLVSLDLFDIPSSFLRHHLERNKSPGNFIIHSNLGKGLCLPVFNYTFDEYRSKPCLQPSGYYIKEAPDSFTKYIIQSVRWHFVRSASCFVDFPCNLIQHNIGSENPRGCWYVKGVFSVGWKKRWIICEQLKNLAGRNILMSSFFSHCDARKIKMFIVMGHNGHLTRVRGDVC